MKPMTPKIRAKRRTTSQVQSPRAASARFRTRAVTTVAAMNMMPPMVGVPCLDMCQVGPSSLMDWPAFSRRSMGMRNLPRTALMAKPRITAARIFIDVGSIPLYLRVFLLFSLGPLPGPEH